MVERMIKTLKSGLFVVSSIDLDNWDFLLPWILFGYKCGVQTNTKFFPFMMLTRKTPRFTCDNGLSTFINVQKDELTLDEITQLMVEKLKLIFDMHSPVLEMWTKHRRGKQEFSRLEEGRTMVKMRRPGKKRTLLANWEGPYTFVKYKDKEGCRKFNDGCRIYILQGIDGKQWERARHNL
jgi:hypothetical protein